MLPRGTRISVEISYDNSSTNPHQPSHPPKEIWWGEGSFDEMGSMSLQGVCVNQEDQQVLLSAVRLSAREAFAKALRDGTIARIGFGLR